MRTLTLSFCLAAALSAQSVRIRPASPVYMPAPVDSNSPAYWRDGQLNLITSANMPLINRGSNQFLEFETEAIDVIAPGVTSLWVEAAWADDDGTVFFWYHHEPANVCPGSSLTAPKIGAAISYDGGKTLQDLGFIIESGDTPDCTAKNGFFAGGNGDFSVILDRNREYFYFLFTHYAGEPSAQGIAVARMPFEARYSPVGQVQKYFEGEWNEPGLFGRVTAVYPAFTVWQRSNADSFWGPSIHWNTELEMFVVLMNRACCAPMWPQEGVYLSAIRDLADPASWGSPTLILDEVGYKPGYYVQVLGIREGETDTLAGKVARLYVQGISKWELEFTRPDPPPPAAEPQEPEPVEPVDPPGGGGEDGEVLDPPAEPEPPPAPGPERQPGPTRRPH